MKYDPYVKRYITLEDYIKECYGGLPNESMLEEQWNALPDHPYAPSKQISMSFAELYDGLEEVRKHTEKLTKARMIGNILKIRKDWKDGLGVVSEEALNIIFEDLIKNL